MLRCILCILLNCYDIGCPPSKLLSYYFTLDSHLTFYNLFYCVQHIIICTTVKFLLHHTDQELCAIPNFTALPQNDEPNNQACLTPVNRVLSSR